MKSLSASLFSPIIPPASLLSVLSEKYPLHHRTLRNPPAWIQAVLDDLNPKQGWQKADANGKVAAPLTLWDVWTKGLDLERLEVLHLKKAELDDPELVNMFEGLGLSGQQKGAEGEEGVWEELFAPAGWEKVLPASSACLLAFFRYLSTADIYCSPS